MTTLRCDVLVLGSTLGGLVAATYLARAGLRVVLIEEEAHAKRPPALREPLLLSGLQSDGWIRRVMREVALPLREQQSVRGQHRALQVVLPDARIDWVPDPAALAAELAAYRICDPGPAVAWLEAHGERAEEIRAALWNEGSVRKVRTGSLPGAPSTRAGHLLAALYAASRPLGAPPAPTEGSLLLTAARQAIFRMPHAGTPFLDLFRRRLLSLYGEIHGATSFGLHADRQGFQVELARGSFHARALVVAAARGLLRQAVHDPARAPEGLLSGAPPRHFPVRLFRVEVGSLPTGMGDRTIVACGPPDTLCAYSRSADPGDPGVEWLQVHGPGAAQLPDDNPLGALCPFAPRGIVPIDCGPGPVWDLDAGELRFGPGPRTWPRSRLPLCFVGPEAAATLGFEGEVLMARARAQALARQMTQRRPPVAFHRAI